MAELEEAVAIDEVLTAEQLADVAEAHAAEELLNIEAAREVVEAAAEDGSIGLEDAAALEDALDVEEVAVLENVEEIEQTLAVAEAEIAEELAAEVAVVELLEEQQPAPAEAEALQGEPAFDAADLSRERHRLPNLKVTQIRNGAAVLRQPARRTMLPPGQRIRRRSTRRQMQSRRTIRILTKPLK